MRKMYYMSFNVYVNGKVDSAILPRRFEKREWLAQYKEYLVNLAYDMLCNANGELLTSDNYLKYINKMALPYLSTEELDFVLMYEVKEYFRVRKIKNVLTMNIGISTIEV